KSKPTKAPEPVAKPGLSEAEAQKLRDMQDQMEKDLASAGMQMTTGSGEAGSAVGSVPATVKALNGKAVEPVTAPKADDEPKEYTGEFYPVVKTQHQTDAEKKH